MNLPTLVLPEYELKLPSTGKEIKVRPFIVKEEKLLLMALESGNEKDIIDTTRQVVSNCILTEGIKIDALPFFDVDYLFIALRAKSIGESIDATFTCNNILEAGPCESSFSAKIDISNIGVNIPDIPKDIKLPGNILVRMKYPNYATMKMILDSDHVINKKINIIAGSIDLIQDKTGVFRPKDLKTKELKDFLEGMTKEQFKKLENFVDNFPTFYVKVNAKCPGCGFDHEIQYREFTSFFD